MAKMYEVNAETGEVIERELTNAEKNEATKIAQDLSDAKAAYEAKEAAKSALLARLGLTAEEAALLFQ